MKKIQILGPGCAKCLKLAQNVETAAKELGIEYELTKVTDIREIMSFKVMMTPALVADGEVKLTGTASSVEEIKKIL